MAENDDGNQPTTDELVELFKQSDAHPDVARYILKADERGGTGMLESIRYLCSVNPGEDGPRRWLELGNALENQLWEEGAEATLENPRSGISLDVTNTEIYEEIVEEDRADEEENSVVCPDCESSGFDGQGVVEVEGVRMFLRRCWDCGTRFAVEDDAPLIPDGGEVEPVPVRARFKIPEEHYYGRTVPGGIWHLFDDDEGRSVCGIYNDDGIIQGSNRGVDRTDPPSDLCGSCVGNAPYLELYEEETVEVDGQEVPKPLGEFYQDPLRGLFAVRPGSGRDGVLLYDECSRVGGRAAVEIANDEPQINDESDVAPEVEPPRATFDQLVQEYGLTYEVREGHTYVYVPEEGR